MGLDARLRRAWMAALLVAVWLCHLARKRLRRRLAIKGKASPFVASREASEFRPLRDRLTVLVTTSANGRHPSTDLLDQVLNSLQFAGALACNLIIVCDGYRCAVGEGSASAPPKYRAGIVDAASAANYEMYKRALRRRERAATAAEPAMQLLELEARHGFGHAVRAALEHVRTPYVMVVQHDRPFIRAVDIGRVVDAMEAHPHTLKYMGLPTSTTLGHARNMMRDNGIRLEPIVIDSGGLQALPLLQWYDSTHICEVKHYRSFVFGPQSLVERGGFIEENLGRPQLQDIRKRGVRAAHGRYGTFLVAGSGFEAPCVGHVGHDALSFDKLQLLCAGGPFGAGGAGRDLARPPKKRPTGGATSPGGQSQPPEPPQHAVAPAPATRGPAALAAAAGAAATVAQGPPRPAEAARVPAPTPAASPEPKAAAAKAAQARPAGASPPVEPAPTEHRTAETCRQAGESVPHRGGNGKASTQQEAPGGPAEAQKTLPPAQKAEDDAEARMSRCPSDGWEYVDPRRKVQGPFNLSEMRHWSSKGYFRPELLMRCSPNDKFIPFVELFPPPLVAFESCPKRPKK